MLKQLYLDRVNEVIEEIGEGTDIFDEMMGVSLSGSNDEEVLREIVFKGRYKLIQTAQFIESKIAKRILQTN